MAQQTISDEELQLKKRARRRLVGAIALMLLAVIFLPMVLDKEPKPVGQDIAIHIPSQEDASFQPRIPAPVVAAPTHDASPTSSRKPVESTSPSPEPVIPQATAKNDQASDKTAAGSVEAKPVEVQSKETAQKAAMPAEVQPAKAGVAEKPSKPVAEAKAVHTGKSQGFVILLGAFANLDNAKQRQAKLSELGVHFYSEKIKTPSGEKLRVRAGPYATRDEAEKVLVRLKGQGIKDGIVSEKN